MNPDEVVQHIIKKLESLSSKDRNWLSFYISCLNHSIDAGDTDVFSESSEVLSYLGISKMETANYDSDPHILVNYGDEDDEEE